MSLARWLGWIAAVLAIVILATGYGITEFRTVTSLTLGALSKPVSQSLHLSLGIPLLVVLALHVAVASWGRRRRP